MPRCKTCKYHEEELPCPTTCSRCDAWVESDSSKLKRFEELEKERDDMDRLLQNIGAFAESKSTGPDVPDAFWEIRKMALGY